MEKEMKPILFNSEMVRALREGRKTQTRTPLKVQPIHHTSPKCNPKYNMEWGRFVWAYGESVPDSMLQFAPSQVGDILYVRETWCVNSTCATGCKQSGPFSKYWEHTADGGKRLLCGGAGKYEFTYKTEGSMKYAESACHWRPNIHMPKWAAREFVQVTAAGCERVRDISEKDAKAEGCIKEPLRIGTQDGEITYKGMFMLLWNSLYPGSWERNDWVWVREFKRIEK